MCFIQGDSALCICLATLVFLPTTPLFPSSVNTNNHVGEDNNNKTHLANTIIKGQDVNEWVITTAGGGQAGCWLRWYKAATGTQTQMTTATQRAAAAETLEVHNDCRSLCFTRMGLWMCVVLVLSIRVSGDHVPLPFFAVSKMSLHLWDWHDIWSRYRWCPLG